MKEIKNFLSEEEFLNLQKNILGDYFPWYYNSYVINEKIDNFFQFTHIFYSNYSIQSNYFNIISPLIEKINPKAIIRIKANLLTKTDKIIEHGFHIDTDEETNKIKTAIFYCNTNNGYTKFKNNDIINSEENKLIEFDSNNYHTGTSSTDKNIRVVINLNYYK
jgi:hypothetical protein